jgi:alcohol dehydrogenase (cytochrome c)
MRADGIWAGWLPAVAADTGVRKWRLKSNYPTMNGVTPTAAGLVFLGDMGGNIFALDAATDQKLWGQKTGSAIGGGVITYKANGVQKVAVTTRYISTAAPAKIRRAKIAILGLEGQTGTQ